MADDDFDQDFQEEVTERKPNFRRELEDKAERERARADAAEAKAKEGESAQRELLFLKAGIDTDKGGGKLLAKSYDGEMTIEAIKKAAEEYDIIPTSQQEEVASELNQLNRNQAASSNSSAPTPPDIFSQIKGAKSEAEVLAIARKLGTSISEEQPGEPYAIKL